MASPIAARDHEHAANQLQMFRKVCITTSKVIGCVPATQPSAADKNSPERLLYTQPEIPAMKKTAGLFLLFGFGLTAADFWQKPYTEWSDKDVTKMMTDSPWAKSASVSMGGPGGGGAPPPAPGGFGGGPAAMPRGPQGGGGSEFGPGAQGTSGPSVRCCGSMAIRASDPAGFRTSQVRR